MKTYELEFGLIHILEDDIAEVIIEDGIEVNVAKLDELSDFLESHLASPFSLLINKVNAYTYDFPAQIKIANWEKINAVAVITYSKISKISTESLIKLKKNDKPYIAVFSNREEALNWLHEKRL